MKTVKLMKLSSVMATVKAEPLTNEAESDLTGCYISDLLSDVLAHALGYLARAVVIARLHLRPQHHRFRQLRVIRLARGLRGFASGDFLGAFLQMLHEAGGDVSAGDDSHEFAGAVQHGKTAKAVPVELRHRTHEGKMIAQRDEVPRHPPRRRFVDVALVQGVDDVFDADQSHRDAVLEDGHARDAMGLHQMLEGAQ